MAAYGQFRAAGDDQPRHAEIRRRDGQHPRAHPHHGRVSRERDHGRAGADIVDTDELVAQIQAGEFNFDAAVATPDQMGKVGRLGKILGPRGLMPNPKLGTVTNDVVSAE